MGSSQSLYKSVRILNNNEEKLNVLCSWNNFVTMNEFIMAIKLVETTEKFKMQILKSFIGRDGIGLPTTIDEFIGIIKIFKT